VTAALSRSCVLAVLVAAPLAFGAVHDEARWPFVGLSVLAGAAAWARERQDLALGEESNAVPGWRLLCALHVLVLFQLVRWPAPLLGILSPGSLELYWGRWGGSSYYWLPITVSQRSTLRALPYLVGVSLLYAAAFRGFSERRWAYRLAGTVLGVATLMTLVGFVQRGSEHPGRIYGLWEPLKSDAVFGPYVNRTHYAGHVIMAVPLALAFAASSLRRTTAAWRRSGFSALGEADASRAVLAAGLATFVASGILNCGSRTGIGVLLLTGLVVPLALFRRAALAATLVAGAGGLVAYATADLSWLPAAFASRGFEASRLVVWKDMWPMVGDFPVFGLGLNAMGRAYRVYQTVYLWDYWAEAHNEYYQSLLDLGLVGACLTAGLLFLLFSRAWRGASRSAFGVGLLGALTAQAAANVVDFNWQIPANAATFAALAGVAVGRARDDESRSSDATHTAG
jgi:O-antigen ligase